MANKLIELHKDWCEKKRLPVYNGKTGLCTVIPDEYKEQFDLIKPTGAEIYYWADFGWCDAMWGEKESDPLAIYNSFRQTIVLLICAMRNEI